jgi:GntR family transcriptional regulator, gluconate operon transcriptional repressor
MPESVQRATSLGQQIADILRHRIVRGDLRAGERLTEEALAEEFAVSRGPVRDAVTQLVFEKLVRLQKPRGIYIVGLTDDDVEQLYSLRAALEHLALERAMRVTDDDRWAAMRDAVTRMTEAADRRDYSAFLAADLDFHTQIYELADHSRLEGAWRQYLPTFEALLGVTIDRDEDLHDSAADHERLYRSMRDQDVQRATDVLREHLQGARDRMSDDIAGRAIDAQR